MEEIPKQPPGMVLKLPINNGIVTTIINWLVGFQPSTVVFTSPSSAILVFTPWRPPSTSWVEVVKTLRFEQDSKLLASWCFFLVKKIMNIYLTKMQHLKALFPLQSHLADVFFVSLLG